MAKDFDFLPAGKTPRKHAAQAAATSQTQPRAPSVPRPNPKSKTTAQQPKRIHKTRSSLINYHPLKPAPKAKSAVAQAPTTETIKLTVPATTSAPPYLPPARKAQPTQEKPKRRFNKKTVASVLISFIAVILLTSGLLIPLLENPSVTIVIYIIAAVIFRLNSRVSFSIALLLLLAIPVLLIIRNSALAGTYAIFCFYFLVVGVISATIELRNSDN